MAVQNLERHVDKTIIATDALFRQFEIEDPQEQQLMVRLFKRFFFATIEKKYGYLKPNAIKEKVEISGVIFCKELELNPKVLRLSGVITTFSGDAALNWLGFLRLMCLFLLRKDLRRMRFEFILRFLHLMQASDLVRSDYI